MSTYTLTIGIPTCNRPKRLEEILLMWMRQIDNNYEQTVQIVISDNSNTGETFEMIKKYENKKYLKYIHNNKRNLGYSKNVNSVILNADGEYVWLIADNDIPKEDSVSRLLQLIKRNPSVDYFALNNTLINDATKEVLVERRYFDKKGIVEGEKFMAENLYALGAIGTNVYRTNPLKEVIAQHNSVSSIHQSALLAGLLIFGKKIYVESDAIYIDTYYKKGYSPRSMFEVTVHSLIFVINYFEKTFGKKFYTRKFWYNHTKGTVKTLLLIYIVSGNKFTLKKTEINDILSFDRKTGLWLYVLAFFYGINHRFLMGTLKFIYLILGKDIRRLIASVEAEVLSKMKFNTNNKYLDSHAAGCKKNI